MAALDEQDISILKPAVSALQMGASAIFTIHFEDGDKVTGGAARSRREGDDVMVLILDSGVEVRCRIESINDDPAIVGVVEGQRRFFWKGVVLSAEPGCRSPEVGGS